MPASPAHDFFLEVLLPSVRQKFMDVGFVPIL